MQSDPIGHEGSPVNLYAYCPNPLVQVDVLGLEHDAKTDKSDAKGDDVDGREGTKARESDSKKSIDELAAEDGDTPAHLEARERVAKDFFDSNGMGADYLSLRKGIDMSKPVQVVKYPPPDKLNQYVRNPSPAYPTPKVGNWADPKGGQSGDALGLNDDPACRTPAVLDVPPTADGSQRSALESTSAPIVDDWTDKSNPVSTKGTGTQWTITPSDRDAIAAANPGYS